MKAFKYFVVSIIVIFLISGKKKENLIEQGVVQYEVTIPASPIGPRIQKVKQTVSDPILQRKIIEGLKNQMLKFPFEFQFKKEESVFFQEYGKDVPSEARVFQPLGTLYKNTKKKRLIESKYIFQKKFLIEERLPQIKWVISDSTREILPFKAQMATALLDSQMITAWFTKEIQSNSGPDNLWGLEGLILEVYYENGRTIRFKGFSSLLDNKLIVADKKGKKINRVAFEKEYKKRVASMNEAAKDMNRGGIE